MISRKRYLIGYAGDHQCIYGNESQDGRKKANLRYVEDFKSLKKAINATKGFQSQVPVVVYRLTAICKISPKNKKLIKGR